MSLAFLGGIGTGELILIFVLLCALAFPLVMLINALKSTFRDSTTKLIWVLVILCVPFFGALIYFIVGRNQRIA